MDYNDYPDSELYMMICEENEDAKEILFEKYKYVINIIIKKYSFVATQVGIDSKELYSEALLGFADAINDYKDDKNATFPTFLSLCVGRRLKKAIVHAGAQKNKIINESYSLDKIYDKSGLPLIELISDEGKMDPLVSISEEEHYHELVLKIKSELSKFESQVFDLMINDFNYNEISALLEKTPKQIDNTIQRIKAKAKLILKDTNII